MALTTRDELKTAIAGWLADDGLDDYIDDFIVAAEDRMYVEVRIRELLVHNTAFTLSDGDRYEALPSDFLDVKYLRIRTPAGNAKRFYPPLRELTIAQMTEESLNTEGRPTAFCVHTQFEWDFEVDQDYTAELLYYQKFDRLDADTSSNEILAAAPTLYLWGALAASAMYLQHDERVATWDAAYTTLRDGLNTKHVQNKWAGPLVTKVAGLPRRA